MILNGRGKYGFLTEKVQMSAIASPNYKLWKYENLVIIAWLISTKEPTIENSIMLFPTTKEVWETVKDTF